MKNVTHKLTVTLAAGIAVVAVVALVGAYVFLYLEINKVSSEHMALVEEADLLETQNARTNNIRSLIRANGQLRDELDELFVTENDVVDFLDDIENLGLLSGASLSVESVNRGKVLDKDKIAEELILAIKAEGDLQELFHLLALFEHFPKALSVESVRFTQHATEFFWSGSFRLNLVRLQAVNI